MDYRNGSTGNFRTGYGVDVHYTSEVQNNAEVSGCPELSIQRDSYRTFCNPRFWKRKKEEERFDEANRNLTRTQLFTNRVMTFMMPGMMFIMYGVTILIVWVSAHRIDAGQLQVGAMTAFITYTMQIVMAFLMLTMMSIMLPRAGVAADRIDEVITTNSSIIEKAEKETIEKHTGKVEFHHVNFRYPGADEDVLEDIDFTAEPGKTTAIIGSTGCGKSTLVNLIPRFYDVTAGKITLDGVDIRNLSLAELRDEIGFVPQKGILFSGTIASNLKFGRPEATEAEMTEAAEIAQATEFINEKPENMTAGLHRVERMFPVDRNRDYPSPEQSQRIRMFISLMTVSLHLI